MAALIVFGLLALACIGIALIRISSEGEADGVSKSLGIAALALAIAAVISYPYVNVWQRSMSGQAQMAEAEANRQIKVREAQAIKDSAQLLADAEIARAHGVAEANRIVADGLGGPEGYLRYLYIEGLKEAQRQGAQIIYVPTEAGLPILEASRLK